MDGNVAGIKITLDDGTDLTAKIDPRFVELTLTEKRDGDADELSITLQNADGKLAVPKEGKWINLQIGWVSGTDVKIGLVNKGRFIVDEVSETGPPDQIEIVARSADLSGSYAKRRNHTWHGTTLGAVVRAIAARNKVSASVHPDLDGKPIDALEQHNKADMAFIRDLGRRFDALATWKNKKIVFMPMGSATNAGGKAIAKLTITRREGWKWRFNHAKRFAQDGVQAQYHDSATGERKTVSTGGSNPHRMKRIYGSKAEAQQAAKAHAARQKRNPTSFDYYLAVADCTLRPNMGITLKGWSSTVSGINWLVDSVETNMGAGGIKQHVTFEAAGS